jgi:hypothetical protein
MLLVPEPVLGADEKTALAAVIDGDATTVRDLTFVTDTAAAFMAAGSVDGIEYGQRATSLDEDSLGDSGDMIGGSHCEVQNEHRGAA